MLAMLHCSGCTLFFSTEIIVLVYVERTQGRGNYSIMVDGGFCWLVGDQEFITTNLKASFNKKEETVLKSLGRLKCATDSCVWLVKTLFVSGCGHVLDLLVLTFEEYN